MPTYKLHYFNIRARGEVARLIMAHANVEYEDYRFEFGEFAAIKASKKHFVSLVRLSWFSEERNVFFLAPDYPFGQVPVLEVDGKMLAQSRAISRFLAKKHGLAGKDDWEQAQVDMFTDCVEDLFPKMRPVFLEQDPDKKKELFQEAAEKHLLPHVQLIEKHLKKNGSGYLVGTAVRKKFNGGSIGRVLGAFKIWEKHLKLFK